MTRGLDIDGTVPVPLGQVLRQESFIAVTSHVTLRYVAVALEMVEGCDAKCFLSLATITVTRATILNVGCFSEGWQSYWLIHVRPDV